MDESAAARAVSVPANGWQFTGWEWGPADGPTVLLLHGFPQFSTSWGQVASRLAQVGVHAVALDQRGYSPGARPTDVASYGMPHLVADAVGMLAALGGTAGGVHLAGHDWGGVVGWQVAARHPESVLSWTAVSTPAQPAIDAALASDPAQRGQFGYMKLLRDPGAAQTLLAADGARLRPFYGGKIRDEDATIAAFAEPGVLDAALNWYRAMSRDASSGLAPVPVPTTFVWGSADLAFGRVAAEASGQSVAGAYRFVPLEGASHWLPDEAPDVLAEVIAERVLD